MYLQSIGCTAPECHLMWISITVQPPIKYLTSVSWFSDLPLLPISNAFICCGSSRWLSQLGLILVKISKLPKWFRQWASYQMRKITGCSCAGNAGNLFPATVGLRSQHASRHVHDAYRGHQLAVSFEVAGGKRFRHTRRMRNPQFPYLARGPCHSCEACFCFTLELMTMLMNKIKSHVMKNFVINTCFHDIILVDV